jgi:hypothetical protein
MRSEMPPKTKFPKEISFRSSHFPGSVIFCSFLFHLKGCSESFPILMMKNTLTVLAPFTCFASAHFNLNYPAARGFDQDLIGNFPCGSQCTISKATIWPISGGEIALTMGHVNANVEILIGFGNDVRSPFNTVIRPA